ncbi:MAG: TorD/DmsD family molecular chaperone [Chloroflexota bacterium]
MKDKQLMVYENLRETIYRSLALCYALPTADTLAILPDLEDALRNVCDVAAEAVAALRAEAPSIETLKIDYSRLFIGPFKVLAPPYGSIYLDNARTVMGPSTADVRNRYREFGLDISQDFKDAPDHISAELEFLYYLVFQELEALKQADVESARILLDAQKSFLDAHLGAWVAEFTDRVSAHAETEFYSNLARATAAFIRCDLDNIAEISIPKLADVTAGNGHPDNAS